MKKTEIIRYDLGTTPIGPVFVALSPRGVCTLKLVSPAEKEMALAELRRQFPTAELVHDPEAVAPVLRQLCGLLKGTKKGNDVALDLRGTAFQRHVWKVMQRIPAGKTCSYSELARRAGRPRAVRAVASACARNPVALLVPCHRILRRDGSLGGYRWGLTVKRKLLQRERA